MSWNNAKKYVARRNKKTDKTYRLLSESEWEYAPRAGTDSQYAWFTQNSGNRPHPVGQKKPNGFGLYDMHGNVCEWVEYCYHDFYKGAPNNGSPWTSENCEYGVIHGGSWINNPYSLWSSNRNRHTLSDDFKGNPGFRVAMTLP